MYVPFIHYREPKSDRKPVRIRQLVLSLSCSIYCSRVKRSDSSRAWNRISFCFNLTNRWYILILACQINTVQLRSPDRDEIQPRQKPCPESTRPLSSSMATSRISLCQRQNGPWSTCLVSDFIWTWIILNGFIMRRCLAVKVLVDWKMEMKEVSDGLKEAFYITVRHPN